LSKLKILSEAKDLGRVHVILSEARDIAATASS